MIKDIKYNFITHTFISISILYLELMLCKFSDFSMSVYRSFGITAAAFALGSIIYFLCSIFRNDTAGRIICTILIEVLTIIYIAEFLCNYSFTSFMSFASLTAGAGGVANGFMDEVIMVVKSNINIILLYHIPFVLSIILSIRKKLEFKLSLGTGLFVISCTLGLSLVAVLSFNETDFFKKKFNENFLFDDSVRIFGLIPSFGNELRFAVLPLQEAEIIITEEKDDTPAKEETQYNVLEIDWDSLTEAIGDNKTYNSIFTYIKNRKPSNKNEYTGLFEDKNLVFITAESFHIKLLTDYSEYFPLLSRMYQNGIQIEDYYQPLLGGSTSTGEGQILTGNVPTEGVPSLPLLVNKNNNYTLANNLKKEGYSVIGYHNGDSYYYDRYLTYPALGFSKYLSYGSGLEYYLTNSWPRSDDELLSYVKNDINKYDRFYAYIMTFSGHGAYNLYEEGNYIAWKNSWRLQGSKYQYDQLMGGYIACNYDLELGLEKLYKSLEQSGRLEDTVFIISPDHYPYFFTIFEGQNKIERLYGSKPENNKERDANFLIIWTPDLETLEEPIVVTDPVSSIDLLPTMLNLWGIDFDSRIYSGRDIFSDAEPLVLWADHSWISKDGYYEAGTGVYHPNDTTVPVDEDHFDRTDMEANNRLLYSKYFFKENIYKYFYDAIIENKVTGSGIELPEGE